MQITGWARKRRLQQMVALVVAVVLAIAGLLALGNLPGGKGEPAGEGVRFEVVDGAHRELDGSPALALSFTVLAFNFLGDGLRDAVDPWMGK